MWASGMDVTMNPIENQNELDTDRDMPEELYCLHCRMMKPATDEFWWRNKNYRSGWHESVCKKCGLKERRSKGMTYYESEPETFESFERKALEDHIRRVTAPVISIDRAI